ncbi:hypothetical protein QE152_g22747 [Popillia japonica]|uniref:Uncharacterized protein n=1 Tax=Popillia japonica TaxID=7064 RepID=A0AAW1KK09_POPJA
MSKFNTLWTRTSGATKVTTSSLENYGHLLKLNPHKKEILHSVCVNYTITKNILFPSIKDHAKQVLAIDKRKDFIDLANEINKVDKVEYQVFDTMGSDDFENMENRFGQIFSTCIAEWLVPNRLLLKRCHEMLKPGNQIFVVILTNTAIQQSFYEQAEEKGWKPYLSKKTIFETYTKNPQHYFEKLLKENNFKPDICQSANTTVDGENSPDMLHLIWPMYEQFWNCIPDKMKEDFVEENVNRCLKKMTYVGEPKKYSMSLQK